MRFVSVVKDATWKTLNDATFFDWLKADFPHRRDLQQPFALYYAAQVAGAFDRKNVGRDQ